MLTEQQLYTKVWNQTHPGRNAETQKRFRQRHPEYKEKNRLRMRRIREINKAMREYEQIKREVIEYEARYRMEK